MAIDTKAQRRKKYLAAIDKSRTPEARAANLARNQKAADVQAERERKGIRTTVGTGDQAVEVRGEEAAAEERIRQQAAAEAQQQPQGVTIELDRSFQQPTEDQPVLPTGTPSLTEAIFTDKTFKPELGYSVGVISTALAIYSGAGLALRGLGALGIRGIGMAAAGKMPTTAIQHTLSGGKIKVLINNPMTAKLSTSYLSKIVKASKNPVFVLGTIGATLGTYPWASWSEKEGIDGLVIGKRTALEAGDLDLADEIDVAMEDVTNPDTWKQIWNAIPLANVLAANKVKLKGSIFNQRALDRVKDNLRAREAAGLPLDEAGYWAAIAEEKQLAKKEERKEDEAYYSKLETERLTRKAEERTADEEYFERIAENNRKRKLEESEEDTKFFEEKKNLKTKIKEEFTGERFDRDVAAIKAGTKEPGKTPSKFETLSALLPIPGGLISKGVKKVVKYTPIQLQAAQHIMVRALQKGGLGTKAAQKILFKYTGANNMDDALEVARKVALKMGWDY